MKERGQHGIYRTVVGGRKCRMRVVKERKYIYRERERGMKNELGNLVESIKSKVRSLNLKKGKKPYVKMDKSASVKVEIRSRKARKLIEKTLKAADPHTR